MIQGVPTEIIKNKYHKEQQTHWSNTRTLIMTRRERKLKTHKTQMKLKREHTPVSGLFLKLQEAQHT